MLWDRYLVGRQTLSELSTTYRISRKRIQRYFATIPSCDPILGGVWTPVVVVADATYWGRGYGVVVFRAPRLKCNLWWTEIETETANSYRQGRQFIEAKSIRLAAVVLDGKPGIAEVFQDIPVQICHFHQIAIVRRYLTKRSKLPAAQELLSIVATLPDTDEVTFRTALISWHAKWEPLLAERTVNPNTKRWHYTHKRLRSAYRSLQRHLTNLFTYQRYPELGIPNTTNSLDGTFGHMKHLVEVHRGISRLSRYRIISQFLRKNSN